MLADTTDELLTMADMIGVARKWIQKSGTPHEHFDIARSKRKLAVAVGAVEIDRRTLGGILRKRFTQRQSAEMTRPGDVIHDC